MQIVKSERIDLLGRSHGYFPAAFRWRCRRFDVIAVQRCWVERGPASQRLFRVRCVAGSFVLQQSVADDTWQVSRWPLPLLLPWSKPGPAARFPLPRKERRPARRAAANQLVQARVPVRAAAPQAERRLPWTPASQRL